MYACERKKMVRKGRQVDQYTQTGYYLRTFRTVTEAARTVCRDSEGSRTNIRECCEQPRRLKAYGYLWRYTPTHRLLPAPTKTPRKRRRSRAQTHLRDHEDGAGVVPVVGVEHLEGTPTRPAEEAGSDQVVENDERAVRDVLGRAELLDGVDGGLLVRHPPLEDGLVVLGHEAVVGDLGFELPVGGVQHAGGPDDGVVPLAAFFHELFERDVFGAQRPLPDVVPFLVGVEGRGVDVDVVEVALENTLATNGSVGDTSVLTA